MKQLKTIQLTFLNSSTSQSVTVDGLPWYNPDNSTINVAQAAAFHEITADRVRYEISTSRSPDEKQMGEFNTRNGLHPRPGPVLKSILESIYKKHVLSSQIAPVNELMHTRLPVASFVQCVVSRTIDCLEIINAPRRIPKYHS